jgi:hypothetical protein
MEDWKKSAAGLLNPVLPENPENYRKIIEK